MKSFVKKESPSAIEKTLEILIAFTDNNRELGTCEISDLTGFHKATTSRILASLLMTFGVILVSVLTSFVTSNLMLRGDKKERERKVRLEQGVRMLNERFDRLETMLEELKDDKEAN